MEQKFKPLIDGRNSDLWLDMKRAYPIIVKESEEPGYLTSYEKGKVFIKVYMEDLNPHYFTHELLHIYLKTMGVNIANDLKVNIQDTPGLKDIFSPSLQEHLGNCLEHVKMLPLYLARGFRNELFVIDFHKKIMEEKELRELSKSFKCEGTYCKDAIDTYIGKYYAMKTSNNPNFNYDYYFRELKKIDSQLYACLQIFWEEWMQFEIGDPPKKYQAMLGRLMENLENWTLDKKFI